MTILSERPDGFGYYYGFRQGDFRQINVRYENGWWVAYVGGEKIDGKYGYKLAAEHAAMEWMDKHPYSDEA